MTAVVARELTVSYAGLTLGGTSDYLLDGPYKLDVGHEDFTFEARVVVYSNSTSDATFRSACSALETAFRTNKDTLTVAFNASTHVSLADGTTAYDVRASWSKPGTQAGEDAGADTGHSRLYDVRVTGKLPEDLTGRAGLRNLRWSVAWSPARRRTLEVSGVYTMQGATGSFATYLAAIGARVATIQALIAATSGAGGSGTWELVEERAEPDVDDDETTFRRLYEERLYNQTAGTLDDTDVVRSSLRVDRDRAYPGDTGGDVRRVSTLTATWSGHLNRENTTDLRGKWTSKILPWIVAVVRDTAGSGPLAMVDQRPSFDYEENQITATLTFLHAGGGKVLARRVTTADQLDEGISFAKFWKQVGDAASYKAPKARTLKSPVTIRRTVETTEEVIGEVAPPGPSTSAAGAGGFLGGFGIGQALTYTQGETGPGGAGAGGGVSASGQSDGQAPSAGPRWQLLSSTGRWTVLTRGEPGYTYVVTELGRSQTFELVDEEPVGSSAASGSGGGGSGGLSSRTRQSTGS